MISARTPWWKVLLSLIVFGAVSALADTEKTTVRSFPSFPLSSDSVTPLMPGDSSPSLTLFTPAGKPFELMSAFREKPTVIIFYRGGWCPYCNTHLAELGKAEEQLLQLGYQILAISPDRPEKLRESKAKNSIAYQLLSDSKMMAAHAFGIAFKVDDATVKRYKSEYGIDLEADSGETHHALPVPSAFIVDQQAVIRFAYINPDYKVRISKEKLLAAAKKASIQASPS